MPRAVSAWLPTRGGDFAIVRGINGWPPAPAWHGPPVLISRPASVSIFREAPPRSKTPSSLFWPRQALLPAPPPKKRHGSIELGRKAGRGESRAGTHHGFVLALPGPRVGPGRTRENRRGFARQGCSPRSGNPSKRMEGQEGGQALPRSRGCGLVAERYLWMYKQPDTHWAQRPLLSSQWPEGTAVCSAQGLRPARFTEDALHFLLPFSQKLERAGRTARLPRPRLTILQGELG